MEEQKTTFMNTLVPVDLDRRIRLVAAQERLPRSEIVRIACEEFLIRYNGVDHKISNISYLQPTPDCTPVPVIEVEQVDDVLLQHG